MILLFYPARMILRREEKFCSTAALMKCHVTQAVSEATRADTKLGLTAHSHDNFIVTFRIFYLIEVPSISLWNYSQRFKMTGTRHHPA